MGHKVGIIGSSSFIGKYLKSTLEYKDFGEVVEFNRNSRLTPFSYPEAPLSGIYSELEKCDFLFYCAGAGVQSGIRQDIQKIYGVNAFTPIELVNFLTSCFYTGTLITFGSYFEIGANNELHFFDENEVSTSMRSIPGPYSCSKRILTRFYQNKLYKIRWYHLILPTIYGSGENQDRLIPYLIHNLKGGELPKLTKGSQIRQYVHIEDVVLFIYDFILLKPIDCDIYNVVGSDYVTVRRVVEIVYSFFGMERHIGQEISRSDERMHTLLLSNAKLTGQCAWQSNISIEQGIKRYCENY